MCETGAALCGHCTSIATELWVRLSWAYSACLFCVPHLWTIIAVINDLCKWCQRSLRVSNRQRRKFKNANCYTSFWWDHVTYSEQIFPPVCWGSVSVCVLQSQPFPCPRLHAHRCRSTVPQWTVSLTLVPVGFHRTVYVTRTEASAGTTCCCGWKLNTIRYAASSVPFARVDKLQSPPDSGMRGIVCWTLSLRSMGSS